MGGVSHETCWASYKYGIIKMLIHCCTLLDISLRILLWCTDPRKTRMFIWGCGLDESAMAMTDSLYGLQCLSPPNIFLWCAKHEVFYVTCCLLVILNKQNSEKHIKSKGDIVVRRKSSVILNLIHTDLFVYASCEELAVRRTCQSD
jgi:hypothetical protein